MGKVKNCDYCGDDLGGFIERYGEPVSCGKPECDRNARDDLAQQRSEAHEALDRQMDW